MKDGRLKLFTVTISRKIRNKNGRHTRIAYVATHTEWRVRRKIKALWPNYRIDDISVNERYGVYLG